MTERSFNLVVPLAHKATAMRTTDTAGSSRGWSGAVSQLNTRPGDVESTMGPSPAGLGIRTSTTATRTTTTRTTSSVPEPSADWSAHAAPTFTELVEAYLDCRRTKRNSASALAFEARLEHNLRQLYDELIDGWKEAEGKSPEQGMRIDYIWHWGDINIEESRILCNGKREPVVSDHYAVMIETGK